MITEDIVLMVCSAFGGYVAGLATTIVVMNVFDAAQPALLYIVPAVLGSVALHAILRKETGKVSIHVKPHLHDNLYILAKLMQYACVAVAGVQRGKQRGEGS